MDSYKTSVESVALCYHAELVILDWKEREGGEEREKKEGNERKKRKGREREKREKEERESELAADDTLTLTFI